MSVSLVSREVGGTPAVRRAWCVTSRLFFSGSTVRRSRASAVATAASSLFSGQRSSNLQPSLVDLCVYPSQRSYTTAKHATQGELRSNTDAHSLSSAHSPFAEAEELSSQTLGSKPAATSALATAATRLDFKSAYAEVEALFAQQFGSNAAQSSFQCHHHGHHNYQNIYTGHSTFPHAPISASLSSTAVNATAKPIKTAQQMRRQNEKPNNVSRPWSGLWELLTHGRYAGVPSEAKAGHLCGGGTHRYENRRIRSVAAQGNVPSSSTPPHAYPHLSAGNSSHTLYPYNSSAHQTMDNAATALSAASAPPAVQRYWNSYRLWQAVYSHVQQESGALEGIREEIQRVKAAQRSQFQAQLRSATRWSFFVIMPLLTALWVSIFFDSALYRTEVMHLRFVNYEAALAEFENSSGGERRRLALKGKKKSEVRID